MQISTNKVYGDAPISIALKELEIRLDYADPAYTHGIAETFTIDQSKYSLFGASKVAADVMVQEYGRNFAMSTCCLRAFFITFAIFLLFSAGTRAAEPTVILEGSFAATNRLIDPVHFSVLTKEMPLWDSAQGDHRLTGNLTYGPFATGDTLELMVAGFPGIPGVSLELVSAVNGERLALRPTSHPGWRWTRFHWKLPTNWANRNCLLVADDSEKVNGGGWLGVSAPLPHTGQYARASIETLLQLAVFILLILPGLAAVLFFPQFKPSYALAFLLASSALAAYAVFYLYLWHPLIGKTASWAIYAFCATALVLHWRQALARLHQFDFYAPLLLGTAVAALYFSTGFLYGGIESPEGMAMSRFLPGMPPDPLLPHWVAKILAQGEPLRPFFADWLTSDRPPLQAGLNLLIWPFIPVRYGYQVVGIAAQCWVWIGLWVFLRHLGVSLRGTALVFACAIFSGFYLVNSVFCWPKHLPAAFLLLATGLLWGQPKDKTPDTLTTVLAAACMAFALLGHGGSVFGVGGIVIVYLLERRALSLRFILTGALTGLILMAPWTLFQKLADPPGDRLIKYHLAGREPIDPRSSLTVIREAYGELTWQQILNNKCANFRMFICGEDARLFPGISTYIEKLRTGTADREALNRLRLDLRGSAFTHYFQSLGPLAFGLIGLFFAFRRTSDDPDRKAAFLTLHFTLFSTIVWCLLMFKGGSTLIHQSSYFTGACLFASASLGILFLPIALSWYILAANTAWFFFLWTSAPVIAEAGMLPPSAFAGWGVIIVASTMVIGLLLLRTTRLNLNHSSANPVEKLPAIANVETWICLAINRIRSIPPRLPVLFACALIIFLRKPDAILNPQFWAEDGMVFFMGAYEHGLGALTTTYGGYLHAVPRLVAWASLAFDPLWIPAIFNYVPLVLHLSIIAAVFSPRIKLPVKPLLALFIALVPHTGEVFTNLTNVQWILAIGLVLLLIADDARTPLQWVSDLTALTLCGLSGPFLIFLFPLFALHAFQRKTRAAWLLLAIIIIIGGIQGFLIFTNRTEFARHTPVDLPLLFSSLSARHWGAFFAGYAIPAVSASFQWIALGVIGLALFVWVSIKPGPTRNLRLTLAAVWACFSLPVAIKFVREAWAIAGVDLGDRYFFLPHLLLGWIIILHATECTGWKRFLTATLLLTAIMTNIPHMRQKPLIDYHWAEHIQPIREGKAFNIPINPEGFGISGSAIVTPPPNDPLK